VSLLQSSTASCSAQKNNRCLRNPIYIAWEDAEFVNAKEGGPQHKHFGTDLLQLPT
jgi:hypothetical protein